MKNPYFHTYFCSTTSLQCVCFCAFRCQGGSLSLDEEKNGKKKLQILIAGGGIGGLVLALAAKNRGFDVKVFEKNLSAVIGGDQHLGPIQLLS
uniref:Zeaxanthin epoxidase, chloroplastic-like n=1 Tax=Nelumbo nucifera TaxID=4432 RepID=A0A822YKW6_NELNU|nr:TPA_asm: hypothetical protein HUJ06_010407 [Nelumbo nucifera]